MLESLREKLNFFLKEEPTEQKRPSLRQKQPNGGNAGAHVLAKYQHQWMLLHKMSEETAAKADVVDGMIAVLHRSCLKQERLIGEFNSQLSILPKVKQTVQILLHKTNALEDAFDEVEKGLDQLEDLIEMQELQGKRVEERYQLALMKEKKLAKLEQVKVQLAKAHAEKMQAFESRQQNILRERQETFKEAFEEELQHYKTHGRIERIPSVDKNIPLEEVQLDEDPTALNAFLAEEATEDNVRHYAVVNALAEAIDAEDEETSTTQ